MATKRSAFGAKLLLGDDADPQEFTEVPGVGDFGLPLPQTELEDVTSHDSAGRWRERVQTVRDAGTIAIPLQFDYEDPTHQELVQATADLDGRRRFQVHAPDDTVLAEFTAYVSLDGTSALPVAGSINATLNLQVDGEVDLPFLDAA